MLQVRATRRVGLTLAARLAATMAATLATAVGTPALAQSSVQIFGTLDVNITRTSSGGSSQTALDQGGVIPSRLGFRGTEDLGGGLSANFWLESALLPDTGGIMGAFFNRRSTVALASAQWGELRLGRDYAPTFWNLNRFSPFGTSGVGATSNIISGWPFGLGHGPGPGNPTRATPLVRLDNTVGYFLPRGLGGFYGQVMVNATEGNVGVRYQGARLGYAAGSLDLAAAFSTTRLASGASYRSSTLGASYDFGMAKLYGNYYLQRVPGIQSTNIVLGAGVPVGLGEFKLSVAQTNESGAGVAADDATQLAVGYLYRLSKRTSVYAFASRVRNKGAAQYNVGSGVPAVAGANATGVQLGVSHDF